MVEDTYLDFSLHIMQEYFAGYVGRAMPFQNGVKDKPSS